MPLRQAGRTLYCLDHTRPVYDIKIGGVCFCCGQRDCKGTVAPNLSSMNSHVLRTTK